MFNSVTPMAPEPITQMMQLYTSDERPSKLNLCIGVYLDDETGKLNLPVTIRAKRMLAEEKIDAPINLEILGQASFRSAVKQLLTSGFSVQNRFTSVIQTMGASGAIHLALKLLHQHQKCDTIWVSQPTWGNHTQIAETCGLEVQYYPHPIAPNGNLAVKDMMERWQYAKAGDILLLQGCCHNPTGIDPTLDQLRSIARFCNEKGLIPLIDHAYFGLSNGLEEDRALFSIFASECKAFFVATSFSKSLSLYQERVGSLTLFTQSEQEIQKFEQVSKQYIRASYSMPPSFGGSIVTKILTSPELYDQWQKDLLSIRKTLDRRREQFLNLLNENGLTDIIKNPHTNGMFLLLNIEQEQIEKLKSQFGIYMLSNGRVSIASLLSKDIHPVVRALKEVTGLQDSITKQ